jgi:IS5 family transposase
MGGKQLGFSDYELTTAKKQTKREKFLAEMEAVVPCQALIDLIEPYNPQSEQERTILTLRHLLEKHELG